MPTGARLLMRKKARPRVCMLILNEIIRDGGVLRSAKALSREYDLTVLGVTRKKFDFNPTEHRKAHGLKMDWIPLNLSAHLPRSALGYGARYAEATAGLIAKGVSLKPRVIHAHEWSTLPIALAIQTLTRARIVYDCHELYREMTHSQSQWWWTLSAKMETWVMGHCAGIIACNHYRAEIMRDEYGAPFLPTVVRNVPSYREFQLSSVLRDYTRRRNPNIRRIVLHQGNIMVGRSLEILPRALTYLPPDVAMVLVGGGSGSFAGKLEQMAEELEQADRFFIHPGVNHAELFRMTCSADVGVVIYRNTCRNNYYCAPNKLTEYAQAALPAVGADLPPIREFFEQYKTGIAFDPEDSKSLADAINALLSSDDKYQQYKRNCLTTAKVMTWERESQILLNIYNRVLHNC